MLRTSALVLKTKSRENHMPKHKTEFAEFDRVMDGLLAVPYSELQKKLEEEKQEKAKKRKRPTLPASSVRASSSRKKRVA